MDREIGFIGAPTREQRSASAAAATPIPERMRSYNLPTDQYSKYWTSVHRQQLRQRAADTRVAIYINCHGSHDVKKASDPTADVYPPNVPKLCASCHADAQRMEPYGIPTDQYAIYEKSVHGRALLSERRHSAAPSCASCHGSHDAKPPRSTEVVETPGESQHGHPGALHAEPPAPSSRRRRPSAGPATGTARCLRSRPKRYPSTPSHPTTSARPVTTLRPGRSASSSTAYQGSGRPTLRHLPSPGFGYLCPGRGDRRLAVRGRTARTPRHGSPRPPTWA